MKSKINSLQIATTIIITIISVFIEITLFTIIKSSGRDAWISIILSFIISFIYYFAFKTIFNYEPSLPLYKKINKIFNKGIAYIINITLILCAIYISCNILFNLETFIVSQFLSTTPLYVVGILFSLIVYYINSKGIETITRTSLIIYVINTLLFAVAFIGLSNSIRLDNFMPVLEYGITKPIKGILYILSFNISPIIFISIIPKNSIVDKNKSIKYIKYSVCYTFLIMLLTILATLGNLGLYLAIYFQYPEYIVLKNIDLFVFFDSVENILSIQWILGLLFNIVFYVYYVKTSINTKKINNNVLIVLIMIIILLLTNIFIKSNTFFNYTLYNYSYYIGIILTIIIILIAIIIKIKKK